MRIARGLLAAFIVALGLVAAPPAAPAQTVVKLATLVPEGSTWHRILADQGDEWKRITGGRVELRLYPGGVAGDDPDVVRKMRIGQFQAATVSSQGLAAIDEAFHVFGMPMFFRSVDELYYVTGQLEPVLRQRLESKGFVLVNWAYGGWVHLYSKRPVRSLADLRSQKLFFWGSDDTQMRIWRGQGLQPVGLAATDIMMGLQTGMIDALGTMPIGALSLQWFRQAPNQLEEGLAPLMGATLMTRQSFNALPQQERGALMAAGVRAGQRMRIEIPQQEQRAVNEMRQRGLTVTSIAPAAQAEWLRTGEALAAAFRGAVVPADVYDAAVRARDEFRRQTTAKVR